MREVHWLSLALVGGLLSGCATANHDVPTDPVAHHITVFSEPSGATVHFDPGIAPDAPRAAAAAAAAPGDGPYHDTLPTAVTPLECFEIPAHPKADGGALAHFVVVEKPGYARRVVELTPEQVDALGGEYVYDHVFLKVALQPVAAK
jgi:hypothetical protein